MVQRSISMPLSSRCRQTWFCRAGDVFGPEGGPGGRVVRDVRLDLRKLGDELGDGGADTRIGRQRAWRIIGERDLLAEVRGLVAAGLRIGRRAGQIGVQHVGQRRA